MEVDRRRPTPTRTGACRSTAAAARRLPARPGRRRAWPASANVPLTRKTSSPPGRSSRAASGDPEVGVAPDRRAVLGDGEVERRVRERHVLARSRGGAGTRARAPPASAARSRAAPRSSRRRRRGRRAGRATPRRTRCRSRARPRPCRRRRRASATSLSGTSRMPQRDLVGRPVPLRALDVVRRLLRPDLAVDRGVVGQLFRQTLVAHDRAVPGRLRVVSRQISSIGHDRAHSVSSGVR